MKATSAIFICLLFSLCSIFAVHVSVKEMNTLDLEGDNMNFVQTKAKNKVKALVYKKQDVIATTAATQTPGTTAAPIPGAQVTADATENGAFQKSIIAVMVIFLFLF